MWVFSPSPSPPPYIAIKNLKCLNIRENKVGRTSPTPSLASLDPCKTPNVIIMTKRSCGTDNNKYILKSNGKENILWLLSTFPNKNPSFTSQKPSQSNKNIRLLSFLQAGIIGLQGRSAGCELLFLQRREGQAAYATAATGAGEGTVTMEANWKSALEPRKGRAV